MSEGTPIKVNVAAGVLIEQDNKFLLVQEKKESCYGQWNLPARKVDEGYTIEQTAVKEAKEETGYEVELGTKLCVVHQSETRPVKHAFKAKIIGGELNPPEDEILDAKWFTFDEIKSMDKKGEIRDSWVFDAIESKTSNNQKLDSIIKSSPIVDLDGAVFYSKDIDKITDFYTSKLDFKVFDRQGNHFVSFSFPNGGKLGIRAEKGERETAGHQTAFISVCNIEKKFKECQELGLNIIKPITIHDWGTAFEILDPDNNKIEFIERM